MATDKTIAEGARRAPGWSRTVNLVNPLRAVWWLFTNVRFAIVLLAVLTVVSLLGVVIPQVPSAMRGNALAEAAWLSTQEDRFGALTDPMDALGLFDIFHQGWFEFLLAITVASTGAYIVSRFPGVWLAITKPRKRVPDRYFEMAPHRLHSETRVEPERLVSVLRSKRYRVEQIADAGSVYVFADRFQWALLGSLLTHAAVIVFVLAAVVSRVDAFSSPLFLAENGTLPVFPVKDAEQMQVQLVDAYAEFAPDGQPLDYRADLIIYKRGDEVLQCSSTVNTPCKYDGYRFYQVAYFSYGAEVVVRDIASGNVIYRETLPLAERSPSPRITVRNGDDVILNETVLLTENVDTADGAFRAGLVRLPDGRALTLWQPEDGGDLLIFEPGSGDNTVRVTLAEGDTETSAGLVLAYEETVNVPALLVDDFPLPAEAGRGATGEAILQMNNVVYGNERISDGDTTVQTPPEGSPSLTLVGLDTQPITLGPGDSTEVGGLEYTFEGSREFSGIDVRRDRSDTLVWIGAFCTVIGLMITFWVPRRRLWARISLRHEDTAAQPPAADSLPPLALAGQAPTHANFTRELADIARKSGANVNGMEDDD